MSVMLVHIDGLLGRIAHLADQLGEDPDQHLHRAVLELREAFDDRRAIEPAFARMRETVRMLRRGELIRRRSGLDALDEVVERELLPQLRRVGFDL